MGFIVYSNIIRVYFPILFYISFQVIEWNTSVADDVVERRFVLRFVCFYS